MSEFDIRSLSQDSTNNNQDKNREQIKQPVAEPAITLFMTRDEAKTKGNSVLELFNLFNTNSNSPDKIDEQEYENYKNNNIHNKPSHKKFEDINRKILNDLGGDEFINEVAKYENSSVKRLNEYGIDLSKYETEEEKQNAILNAVKAHSNIDKEIERLKQGKFTEAELKYINKESQLNAQQLEYFAKKAVQNQEIKELSKLLASKDKETIQLVLGSLDKYDAYVQTSVISMAIYSGETKEAQRLNAEKILKNPNIKLSDEVEEHLRLAMDAIASNADIKNSIEFITNREHFTNGNAQYVAFEQLNISERSKVMRGELSQEEYNNNYINVYAKSANKVELASKAYKYILDNTNDENRLETTKVLASNIHEIKNDAERAQAISVIKNDKGYNEEIDVAIESSFIKTTLINIENRAGIDENKTYSYDELIKIIINNGNDKEIEAFIQESSKNADISNFRKEIKQEKLSKLIDALITKKMQNSEQGLKAISMLSMKSAATLYNTFFQCNNKETHDFFIDNHLVSIAGIAMYAKESDLRNLSDELQEKIDEYKFKNDFQYA